MCLSHICFPLLASTTVSLYIRFAYAKEVKWKIKHGDDKREMDERKKKLWQENRDLEVLDIYKRLTSYITQADCFVRVYKPICS